MRKAIRWLLWMSLAGWAWGQQASSNPGAVPTVIRFSGNLADADGKPLSGMEGVTFSLYTDQQGGAPLWVETQNVQADKSGHYTVTLGSTSSQGLPQAIFTSGEARWLGVQAQAQAEQPRVLVMSVPYALKAGDAETVGGLPPSAFMKASSADGTGTNTTSNLPPVTGGGKPGFIASWKTATQLTSSKLFQSAAGNIGVGTAKPAGNLDVNGTAIVRNTLTLFPNGSAPTLTVNGTAFTVSNTGLVSFVSGQTFPGTGTITGVTTASGSGLTGGGTSGNLNLALTNTCAANQVLQWSGSLWVCSNAGAGTITGVTAGTDLTGGGSSGNVTLNLDITKVPQLNTANTFTGDQTVNGNLSATGTVTGSSFQIGSNLFAFGSLANNNAFLGFAGNTKATGNWNTATGSYALVNDTTGFENTANGSEALLANTTGIANTATGTGALGGNTTGLANTATGSNALLFSTTGNYNTATGDDALADNTTGGYNTATGNNALSYNSTGNYNTATGFNAGITADRGNMGGSLDTFLGYQAVVSTGTLTNATAIGANAEVSVSNAMVLGSINGVNQATANTNVGIGTTSPAYSLDVHGTGNFTGPITFASGQTFPGTGTITGVTTGAGSGLTGGGTSGSLNLALTNSCAANQVLQWSGSGWVCSNAGTGTITGVFGGTDLTGSGTSGNVTLNLDITKVPQLATANNFATTQTISSGDLVLGNGNIDLPQTASGVQGVVTMGGLPFIHACCSSSNYNTYVGLSAGGAFNTGAYYETAEGYQALMSNTSGVFNTAIGSSTLTANTSGAGNTAIGSAALTANTTGVRNVAVGYGALPNNTSDNLNTAVGSSAFLGLQSGSNNTELGGRLSDTFFSGSNNTFLGAESKPGPATTLNGTTAIGAGAIVGAQGANLSNATAVGANALVTASNALVLGSINGVNGGAADTFVGIGTTAPTYLLHIGNSGGTSYNNFLRVEGPTTAGTGGLAASFGGYGAFGIDSVGTPGGRFVVTEIGRVGIGAASPSVTHSLTIGQNTGHAIADGWDTYSSRRWKTNIQTLHGALAKVEHLRGVSYDLKDSGKHEVGVIAEEVGAVVPEIVSWEKNGKDAQGVDYSRLTALLIEATKDQQTLIDKQQQRINTQQAQLASQRAEIASLRDSNAQQAHALQTVAAQMTLLQSKLAQLEGNVSDLRQARKAAAAGANGRQVGLQSHHL
jgi:hypothetical protein